MKRVLLFLATLASLTGCVNFSYKPLDQSTSNRSPASFNETMVNQSEVLAKIVLLIKDDQLLSSTAKQKDLRDLTTQLASYSHRIGEQAPLGDPALQFVSRDFSNDLQFTLKTMEQNDWAKATNQLSNVTSYCVACHTMQNSAALKSSMGDAFKSLPPLQKADFHIALRQFDDAILNYELTLRDPQFANQNPAEWNKAVQKMLAIAVRVKGNPSLTMELISQFFDVESYPKDLRESALKWRIYAKAWRSEKSQVENPLSKAKSLLDEAQKIQGNSKRPDAFIQYLRASSLLHTFLRDQANAKNQEALFLSGRTARAMADMNFFAFPEDYFRACMGVDESSSWGQKCKSELKLK